MKSEDVQHAVELAERLQRGESLTTRDRDALASFVYDRATEILKPKNAAHRPAKNLDRDFWATMEYEVRSDGETVEAIAERWNLEGRHLSTIMARKKNYWQKEVRAKLKERPATFWKSLVPIFRERILQKSASSVVVNGG